MKQSLFIYFCLAIISVVIISICAMFSSILYPLKYKSYIVKNCEKYELDKSLVASIIYNESHFKANSLSHKGAVGLMQLMPSTAGSFYDEGDITAQKLQNPAINIEIGCKYLEYLYKKYEDINMVLAAYNAGETQARAWKGEDQKLDINKISWTETYNYLNNVLKMQNIYKDRF